jgi:hypothetical protein
MRGAVSLAVRIDAAAENGKQPVTPRPEANCASGNDFKIMVGFSG